LALGEGGDTGAIDGRDQGLKAGGDDIGIHSHTPPCLAVCRLNLDVSRCACLRARANRMFLIVDEINFDPAAIFKRLSRCS
jgi:hypothetical protein